MQEPLALILSGRTEIHLTRLPDGKTLLHPDAAAGLACMAAEAREAGIELAVCSAFRSYGHQLRIWNEKATGQRRIVDAQLRRVEVTAHSPDEVLEAILRWSAVPGASRHHWGTDLDVFDAAALAPGYRLELVPEGYQPGGVFERMTGWLDRHAARFGFFRPYSRDRGGVHPEPWHLSYAPVSVPFLKHYSLELFASIVHEAMLELRKPLEARLEEIYQDYVINVDGPGGAELYGAPKKA